MEARRRGRGSVAAGSWPPRRRDAGGRRAGLVEPAGLLGQRPSTSAGRGRARAGWPSWVSTTQLGERRAAPGAGQLPALGTPAPTRPHGKQGISLGTLTPRPHRARSPFAGGRRGAAALLPPLLSGFPSSCRARSCVQGQSLARLCTRVCTAQTGKLVEVCMGYCTLIGGVYGCARRELQGAAQPQTHEGHGTPPPAPTARAGAVASRLPKFISKIKNKILKTESLALPPAPSLPETHKKDFYRQKTHHMGSLFAQIS